MRSPRCRFATTWMLSRLTTGPQVVQDSLEPPYGAIGDGALAVGYSPSGLV
jgi:hypothetical protein